MDKYILKIDNSGDNKEELIVKKSKFISKVWYISSKEEAEEIIEEQRKIYADARHVVFAYRLENVGKYTDDKEPQGTAGKPIYSLLEKENIFNVLVVVIRYFGGILLGTGGLVRAYTGAVQEALANVEEVTKDLGLEVKIQVSYPDLEKLKYYLKQNEIEITGSEYNENVDVFVDITVDKYERLLKAVENYDLNFNVILTEKIAEKYIVLDK